MKQLAARALVLLMVFVAACSGSADQDQAATTENAAELAATPTVEAVAAPSPTGTSLPTATPEPTPTPLPTATPIPTATPEPTATPTPVPTPTPVDTTPVVVQGVDWAITEADIERLRGFIERTHQLEFTGDVRVLVSDDIGLEYAPDYEAFNENEWYLLQSLGLIELDVAREAINQARRDRIRGVCCRGEDVLEVVVEIEETKLEAETIVVHELTHALHRQHPELFDFSLYDTDETPRPHAVATEGVAQFVAFEYFAQAPEELKAEAAGELPIIRDDMIGLVGPIAAQHLNFAYGVGPEFVATIVADRGVTGLFDLLATPPSTTEQIEFPEKYLAGETAVPVIGPTPPTGAQVRASGTIGVVMLTYLFDEVHGPQLTRQLVDGWAGDGFVTYEIEGDLCLAATIGIDPLIGEVTGFAAALEQSLAARFPDVATVVDGDTVSLRTCGLAR